jgi:hypothetical protein
VATVSTRSIGRTELRRCWRDRAGHEGSYQATQPSFKTLGVGSSAQIAEASEAHFCVPPLRNGAVEGEAHAEDDVVRVTHSEPSSLTCRASVSY